MNESFTLRPGICIKVNGVLFALTEWLMTALINKVIEMFSTQQPQLHVRTDTFLSHNHKSMTTFRSESGPQTM